VLATVQDRHFGSGSGLEPNLRKSDGLGCQYTRTVNPGTVGWLNPNLSEFGRSSADCLAGPSIDSYKGLVFAFYLSYVTKIVFSTFNDTCLHSVQLAILINLEAVFFLLYIEFLAIKVVNNSVISSLICAKP